MTAIVCSLSISPTTSPEYSFSQGLTLDPHNTGTQWPSTSQTALQNAYAALPPSDEARQLIDSYYEYAV